MSLTSAGFSQSQRKQKRQAQQKCCKAGLPHHACGPINGVGKQRPSPRRSPAHASAINSLADSIQRQTRQRGKHAVEGKNHPCRKRTINTEYFKDSSQQIRIQWRRPGARSTGQISRRSEALPTRDRTGKPSHFPAILKMIKSRGDAIGMPYGDDGQPH